MYSSISPCADVGVLGASFDDDDDDDPSSSSSSSFPAAALARITRL
jgi:hypothetical protein